MDLNSLLSGAAGGILILLINIVYSRREAKSADKNELKALLRLVDVEIFANDEKLRACLKAGEFDWFAIAGLFSKNWDQVKARVSALMPGEQVDSLALYHENLSQVLTAVGVHGEALNRPGVWGIMRTLLKNTRSLGSLACHDTKPYLNPERYESLFSVPDLEPPAR